MISIAMTSYNGEKYIIEQLDSIRTQTMPPDEVIISDDGSKDNTVSIVKNYIDRYSLSGWRVIENPQNMGYIKNFWDTILMTKGDYIFLADQDDLWGEDKIQSMVCIMEKYKALMLHTEVDVIDNEGKTIRKAMNRIPEGTRNVDLKAYMRKSHYCGMSSAMSGKMRNLMEPLSIDKFPTHDWCLGVLAAMHDGFYTDNHIFSYRRSHGDNVALNMDNVRRQGIPQRVNTIDSYLQLYEAALCIADCSDVKENTKKTINKFISVCADRKKALNSKNMLITLKNLRQLSWFPSPGAWVSDFMYLIGAF